MPQSGEAFKEIDDRPGRAFVDIAVRIFLVAADQIDPVLRRLDHKALDRNLRGINPGLARSLAVADDIVLGLVGQARLNGSRGDTSAIAITARHAGDGPEPEH